MAIPVHLTVHVLGLTVASGLAVHALTHRDEVPGGWVALVLGGILLALSHLAGGALLATDLAWQVYLRGAGYAAIAVGAAGPIVGAPVVVALGPPAAHLAAAAAGVLAAFATARGVIGRGRAVLPLAGGLVLWAASDLAFRSSVPLGAGLSIAGSLAAGAWLVRRARGSLPARFAVVSIAILLALVIGLAAASGVIFSLDLERDRLDTIDDLATTRAGQITEDWPAELRRTAAPLAGTPLAAEFNEVSLGQRDDLDSRAATLADLFGVDGVVLVLSDGRAVGSWDADAAAPGPMAPGKALSLAGSQVVTTALAGNAAGGLVPLGEHDLVAVGAVPVVPRDEQGQPQRDRSPGVVALTRSVTSAAYVEQVAAQTGLDAAIVLADGSATSSLPAALLDDLAAAVAQSAETRAVEIGGSRRLMATEALRDADGTTVGWVALTEDASSLAGREQNATRSLFGLALAGILLAAALAVVTARRVTQPIRRLTDAAEQVAEGDLSVRLDAEGEDEVARLASAFDEMTTALSDREQALRDAAATEARLRSRLEVITSSMDEALIAVDRDGRVTTANPAALDLLEDDTVVGRDITRVLRASDETGRPLLASLGGPDARGAASARGGVVRARRVVPVAATAAPLRDDDGHPLGRVYVLRDVSGEVEVERMKTEFLANISHELRTPLTPIKGYAEVLRAKDVGFERTAEFAGNITTSALRLERIIGMLVDFAALEAGRMEVVIAPTALGSVVDESLARWRQRRPDRDYRRRLRRGLPDVQVDPDLLDRVLEELIDNATKFSDGPVRILADRADDGRVALTVRDEGSGIEPDELDVILRDFHQADGSATRRFGGLGLGLSIVQRILDRFDADIEVRSEVGRGTDVVVHLPVVAS